MALEISADLVAALRPSTSVLEPRQNPIGNTFLNWWWTGEDIVPEMQARPHSYSGYVSHQQKIIAEDELPVGKCTATPEQEAKSGRIRSKTVPRRFEITLTRTAEGQHSDKDATDTPTTKCSTTWDDAQDSGLDDNDLSDTPTSTGEATTLMLRNLPEHIVQQDLINALNAAGFNGLFDFCYMPSIFATGMGKGYAFINCISADSAESLRSAWEGRSPLGKSKKGRLRASLALIQGRNANIRKWNTRKTMRIRNPNHRPFIPGASEVTE